MKPSQRPCSLFEAMLWMCSYQFAQGIVLILFLVLLVTAGYGLDWPSEQARVELALNLNLDRSFLLTGVTSLGAIFLVIPLLRLRLGAHFRNLIGWRTPRHEELIYAFATVVPIAVLGDMLYEVGRAWSARGALGELLGHSVLASPLESMQASFQGVPYPVLVVALAVGPAFCEELIFRGIIGRGLVHRYGPWVGSAITVALFAVAHVSPAHGIATVPIAILLQFLYLKTKTIWVPIFVHFCNNLLAVSMMHYQFVPDVPLSPSLALIFFCYLMVLLATFETRMQSWDVA